jgi:hypothetical protein
MPPRPSKTIFVASDGADVYCEHEGTRWFLVRYLNERAMQTLASHVKQLGYTTPRTGRAPCVKLAGVMQSLAVAYGEVLPHLSPWRWRILVGVAVVGGGRWDARR